jgi:hypothetical protein
MRLLYIEIMFYAIALMDYARTIRRAPVRRGCGHQIVGKWIGNPKRWVGYFSNLSCDLEITVACDLA